MRYDIKSAGFTDPDNLTSDSIIIMINKHQSSSILITTALIAATMLVSTVIVEALDLIDDAEAKKAGKPKKCKDCGGGDRPNR